MSGLDRTFEAVVVDWDGFDLHSEASVPVLRQLVEALCAHSVEVAFIADAELRDLDGRLRARPAGPGQLWLAVDGGGQLVVAGSRACRVVSHQTATATQNAVLDAAVTLLVDRLFDYGLATAIVPGGDGRRRVDLVCEPEWRTRPTTPEGEQLAAVDEFLQASGIPGLAGAAEIAHSACRESGLVDARITTDARYLDIRLLDKSDALRMLLRRFATRGITPGLVLLVGADFATLGGVPSGGSVLLAQAPPGLTVVSVGNDPERLSIDATHLPGGLATVHRLLGEQVRRRERHRVPDVDDDPGWTLRVDDGDPALARVRESWFSLGDGVIGIRGSHEEPDPAETPLALAAGIYGGVGPAQHLIAGPSPLNLDFIVRPGRERRVLDLHSGLLLREAESGTDMVRTLRFVSADQRGVVAFRAEGPPKSPRPGPPLRQLTGRVMTSGHTDDTFWARTRGEQGGIVVAASQRVGSDAGRRVIERIAAFATEARRPPSQGRAVAALERARELGFDRLLADHRAEWARRWADACVSIPDDPQAQLAARFALFHLWNSVARKGEAAVGARGLSGPGYAGHVFWDADIFVLPAIAAMSERSARAMLEYRIRRLPQAQAIARLRGLDGARFPWESAADGDDVTPMSGRASGEWVPIMTGQLEEHISADIAWAACHYADWTGDEAFLTGPGRPLVTETARYWASRSWTEPDGTAHIRHVIGPDEYHEDVDDNAYTNILAGWNLRRAAALEPTSPEAKGWLRLAAALVDNYDSSTGRHEQFAGYDQLEPLLVADIGTPPLAADLLLGSARTGAAQIIKQPDVLMAHYLLPAEMPAGSLAADLDFYLPRTSHGSSLSPAITAALLARAGRPDDAMEHFDVALRLDLEDLTGMTASGLHLATLGGVWQALLFGFAGANVQDGVLSLDPHLPARWPRLQLRFRCLSRRVELDIGRDELGVKVDAPLRIRTPACAPVRVGERLQLIRTADGWGCVADGCRA